MPKSGRVAQAAATIPAPAIKFRLETPSIVLLFFNTHGEIALTSSRSMPVTAVEAATGEQKNDSSQLSEQKLY
jgi:hypothetical protein